MRHIVFLSGLGLFLLFANFTAKVVSTDHFDCSLKFEYKVENTSNGQDNGKIYIKRTAGDGPFVVGLFDLNSREVGFKATKEMKTISSSKYILVFDKLPSGSYLVRVDNGECKKSLTGLEGIQIK